MKKRKSTVNGTKLSFAQRIFDNLCKIEKNVLAAWKRENGKKGNRESGAQQSKESNEGYGEQTKFRLNI